MQAKANQLRPLVTGLLLGAMILLAANSYAAEESVGGNVAPERQSSTQSEGLTNTPSTTGNQRLIFDRLSPEQKIEAFQRLETEEQALVFRWLTDKEKRAVFASLDTKAKVKLFARLDDPDQEYILNGLEDRTKSRLLSGLSSEQRSKWIYRYPGLSMSMPNESEMESRRSEPSAPWDRTAPREQPSLRDRSSLKKNIEKRKKLWPKGESFQKAKPWLKERTWPEKPEELEEEPSRIEKIMSGVFPQTIDRKLTQFGYDFFNTTEPALVPLIDVPVGDDYLLGPGDAFVINLWGRVEAQYEVTVSPDGTIVVPRLGSLTVAQLTFKETRKLLERKFKEYYPDFSMSLTMDRLRTIQVFVIGEVEHPGTYSISGLGTVIDALYAAGGPRKAGSLRNIKVTRQTDTIATLDLYNFLIDGSKAEDIRLRSGDTVFVPVIGAVAGVAGNVRRPGIYEMKKATTIGQLFDLAGGIMPTGYLQNVVVERIANNQRRVVKSFNLTETGSSAGNHLGTILNDGDVVKVFPVNRQMHQVVFLEGHVKYPREYECKPGMRILDLIPSYDALLPEPYLPRAEIIRLAKPDLHPEIIEFNLGALLNGDMRQNLALQDMDRIIVFDISEKMKLPQVTISGAVRHPGTYRLYQGMHVKDLIFRADNLLPSAFMDHASLSRVAVGKSRTDVVTIDFSPQKALAGDSFNDIALKPEDSVYIREIPRYKEALEQKITLEGEFRFPGEYAFTEGERLSAVIDRAGGFTEEAYPFGAVFMREDVKDLQKKRIKEYVNQLEEDILVLTSQSADTSLEQTEADIVLKSLTAKKQLLEKMRNSRPTGRMVVDLKKVLMNPGSDQDFKLQAGDRLVVKKRPDYVNVLGEVYNPTALLVQKDQRVDYYLNQVGGATGTADSDQIYLVKANGTVISKSQEGFWGLANWDAEKHRWALGSFESTKVDPGDTIIVPKKVEKYPWLRVVRSVTEIMYHIAVAAGVIIVAY
jgi:protein involved in polysaccharide export with SLBB domain